MLQIIYILSPSVMLHALAMDIFIPCVPTMATALNTDFSKVQWILSIFVLSTGIGQIFIGPLTDKIGRRRIMLASISLFFLSSLICALAKSIEILIIARIFQGLSTCGTNIATIAIVRDIFDDKTRPRMYSYLNITIAIVPMLAPILGGYLFIWFESWRSTFYFLTGFSLLALILIQQHLPETGPAKSANFIASQLIKRYLKVVSNIQFLTFVACGTTGLTALFLFYSVSSILLIDKLVVAEDQFGYFFGLNAFVYLAASTILSIFQQHFKLKYIVLCGSTLMILGASLMLFWEQKYGLSKSGLIVPNLVITIGVALIFSPSISIAMAPFKYMAGTASAAYGTIQYSSTASIVAFVMQSPTLSTIPLGTTILILSTFIFLLVIHYPSDHLNTVASASKPIDD